MSEMPNCPLCGNEPMSPRDGKDVSCSNGECPLYEPWFSRSDWLKLTRTLKKADATKLPDCALCGKPAVANSFWGKGFEVLVNCSAGCCSGLPESQWRKLGNMELYRLALEEICTASNSDTSTAYLIADEALKGAYGYGD